VWLQGLPGCWCDF